MRLAAPTLILLLACSVLAQVNHSAQKQIVGTWKYDLGSLKFEAPSAKHTKSESGAQGGRDIQAELRKALATTTLTFKPDRRLIVTETRPSSTATGTWLLKGREISVVMTNARSQTPKLELGKDGKNISCTFSIPGAGTARIKLRKVHRP